MPGLLPTLPQCKMLPLLPTPSCANAAVILPDQSPAPNKPGRADAVDRWDACKTTLIKSADAAERKITAKCSSAQLLSSPKKSSTASSCKSWDINKKSPSPRRPPAAKQAAGPLMIAGARTRRRTSRRHGPTGMTMIAMTTFRAVLEAATWRWTTTRSRSRWGCTLDRASSPSPHRSQACFPYQRFWFCLVS
jgi:hypothetical protein